MLFDNDVKREDTEYTLDFVRKFKPDIIIEGLINSHRSDNTTNWQANRLHHYDVIVPNSVIILYRDHHLGSSCLACLCTMSNGHQCIASFARSAEKFFSNIIYERFVMTSPSVID